MVGYGTVDLYWGRCGRVYRCISLLGTYWWSSSLKMFTWDGVIGIQISTGDVMVEMGPFIATGDGVVD